MPSLLFQLFSSWTYMFSAKKNRFVFRSKYSLVTLRCCRRPNWTEQDYLHNIESIEINVMYSNDRPYLPRELPSDLVSYDLGHLPPMPNLISFYVNICFISSLASMPRLEKFKLNMDMHNREHALSQGELSSPEHLPSLPKLRKLCLSYCHVTSLWRFPALVDLYLEHVTGLREIPPLSLLQDFKVVACPDLVRVGDLPSCKYFYLCGAKDAPEVTLPRFFLQKFISFLVYTDVKRMPLLTISCGGNLSLMGHVSECVEGIRGDDGPITGAYINMTGTVPRMSLSGFKSRDIRVGQVLEETWGAIRVLACR